MGIMTLRLSPEDEKAIAEASALAGMNKSEWVRAAVFSQMKRARMQAAIQSLRADLAPLAQASGWLNEDDVLRDANLPSK